jgi:tight adherence protein B
MRFTSILSIAAVACSGLAVYFFFRTGYLPIWRWIMGGANRETEKYQSWVNELYMAWSPEQVRQAAVATRIAIIGGTLATLLITQSIVFAAMVAMSVYWIPVALFRRARHARMKRLEEQVPDAVGIMVSSVRAGSPLPKAIADVSLKMSGPIAEEFGVITREHKGGGLSIEDALARAKVRVPVESFLMVITALIVNSGQGGDLLYILERMAEATRELLRLQKKIETETSEVRAQEKLILFMTPLFGLMSCLFDPGIPETLFHTFFGNLLLAIVVGVQVVAVLWIRRIVNSTV